MQKIYFHQDNAQEHSIKDSVGLQRLFLIKQQHVDDYGYHLTQIKMCVIFVSDDSSKTESKYCYVYEV
jgi:hypothetical protein